MMCKWLTLCHERSNAHFTGMVLEITHASLAAQDGLHRGLVKLQKHWSGVALAWGGCCLAIL